MLQGGGLSLEPVLMVGCKPVFRRVGGGQICTGTSLKELPEQILDHC